MILVVCKRHFRCPVRRKVFTEPDDICGWHRRTTERLRQELYEQTGHQTVKRVAEYYGVGQRLVRESFAHYANERMEAAGLESHTPTFLGMDEFSVRKGHKYQTLFCDLQLRRRVQVVDGRDGESARGYLERLPQPERVRAVAMDMSEAYRGAVQLCLPKAEIVADKMHVIALVNRALDKVRLRIQRARGEEKQGPVYQGRYLFLRNPEDLDDKERRQLNELLRMNRELKRAWQLKEDFRRWYREADGRGARLELKAWEREVQESGPSEYQRLLTTFAEWREEILNYFHYRITNAYLEGSHPSTGRTARPSSGRPMVIATEAIYVCAFCCRKRLSWTETERGKVSRLAQGLCALIASCHPLGRTLFAKSTERECQALSRPWRPVIATDPQDGSELLPYSVPLPIPSHLTTKNPQSFAIDKRKLSLYDHNIIVTDEKLSVACVKYRLEAAELVWIHTYIQEPWR